MSEHVEKQFGVYLVTPQCYWLQTQRWYRQTYQPALESIGLTLIHPWQFDPSNEEIISNINDHNGVERQRMIAEVERSNRITNIRRLRHSSCEAVVICLDDLDSSPRALFELSFALEAQRPVIGLWQSYLATDQEEAINFYMSRFGKVCSELKEVLIELCCKRIDKMQM